MSRISRMIDMFIRAISEIRGFYPSCRRWRSRRHFGLGFPLGNEAIEKADQHDRPESNEFRPPRTVEVQEVRHVKWIFLSFLGRRLEGWPPGAVSRRGKFGVWFGMLV